MILERERIEGLETMERALEHYGANAQMLKCIEEMGELSRALARAMNPNEQTDQANICEEIADVSILIDQLHLHFGKEYIMRLKVSKLRKMKERVDAENRVEDEEAEDTDEDEFYRRCGAAERKRQRNEAEEFRRAFCEALNKLKDAIDMATRE